MNLNRKCICCNIKYSYCPDCNGADRLKPSWYAEFCCEDCKTLWYTATRFNMKRLTKQEAQDVIKSLPLKPVSEYVPCVQRDLGVILKEDPKPKRSRRAEIKPVDEVVDMTPTFIEDATCEVVNQENE